MAIPESARSLRGPGGAAKRARSRGHEASGSPAAPSGIGDPLLQPACPQRAQASGSTDVGMCTRSGSFSSSHTSWPSRSSSGLRFGRSTASRRGGHSLPGPDVAGRLRGRARGAAAGHPEPARLRRSAHGRWGRLLVAYFPLSYAVHPEDLGIWRHLGVTKVDSQIAFDRVSCDSSVLAFLHASTQRSSRSERAHSPLPSSHREPDSVRLLAPRSSLQGGVFASEHGTAALITASARDPPSRAPRPSCATSGSR
jgi:hypothetical protein